MERGRRAGLLAMVATVLMAGVPAAAAAPAYPPTERGPVVETHFGTTVADPYRWLEADVRTDPRVRAWVDGESAFTEHYLAQLPGRDAIRARLTAMWNYERLTVPRVRGQRLFYTRNSGLQNQYVLLAQDGAGPPSVLLDPNGWSKDGATALAEWEPSRDGARVAYTIQDGGTDWRTIRVVDVATGRVLPDEIRWAKFIGLAWRADGSGFFYSRYPEPPAGQTYQQSSIDQRIYFHRLGTAQTDDALVYATPDRPRFNHSAITTDDGRWLVILSYADDSSKFEMAAADLAAAGPVRPRIVVPYGHDLNPIGSRGTTLYFATDDGAPRRRIVAIDATAPGLPAQRAVVAEGAGTIGDASLVGDHLVVTTMEDARSVVRRYGLAGEAQGTVALPGLGTASGFHGNDRAAVSYYAFTSFNRPPTIYRYDADRNASTVFEAPATPFDADRYEVRQLFYLSKDGTRVPMFVSFRKDRGLAAPAPTMLYGYGGFDISLTPSFSVAALHWMEMGGVYVVANLRGGGEYGKAWHDGGRLHNKQNVFDDFIAAAEALIRLHVTTPGQLAINGGSNGGLLVGAVTNQRPDLFAAAIPQVGVMDMLRFDRFTAGRTWIGDYGDPAVEADFRTLRGYSPYHNIRSGVDYPAILVTTADTDDRVVPGHSFKYAAALQAATIGDKPHLIRIETRAGHGSGKPTDKVIEEAADRNAFAAYWTGLKPATP